MEKRINAFVKRYFTGEELIIYQYGLLVGCQFIIFLVFTVIIGISLGMLIESVIFLLTFYSIRSYIGGVHLSKYKGLKPAWIPHWHQNASVKWGIKQNYKWSAMYILILTVRLCISAVLLRKPGRLDVPYEIWI